MPKTVQLALEIDRETVTLADPDVWLCPAVKADGMKYYEYLLVYIDDLMCLLTNPKEILMKIDQHFTLKPGSIGVTKTYLGATDSKFRLPDNPDKERWALGSEQYVSQNVNGIGFKH